MPNVKVLTFLILQRNIQAADILCFAGMLQNWEFKYSVVRFCILNSIIFAHLFKENIVDSVAQLVEHNTFNVGVMGSSPIGITENVANLANLRDYE